MIPNSFNLFWAFKYCFNKNGYNFVNLSNLAKMVALRILKKRDIEKKVMMS